MVEKNRLRTPEDDPDTLQDADDDALVQKLSDGEIVALEVLYTRYGRPVFSLAIRILGDQADAEECTQDVFERVWRHAHVFNRERGRFGTWLLSMTHHVAVDMLRKQRRRPQADYGATTEVAQPTQRIYVTDEIGDATVRNLEGEQIRHMLRTLPTEQRQAIELAFFGGLSHLEIAAYLGDPLGTVKTRIRRGMARLRSSLEGIGLGNDNQQS
ncbi:MAG: sigma-70 family RNA polymerase sigma factor [Herpetosiphon sp.]